MTFPLDHYNALRDGRGFVELPAWSSVTLTGADRQKFLNSFCTNDVKRLTPGESCEVFVTSVKGRVLGHGLVDCRAEELVFITVPNQGPALVAHFDRYIIREDVQVRDNTDERAYFYVGDDPGDFASLAVRQVMWSLLGRATGRLLEVAPADVPRCRATLENAGLTRCEHAAWEALRIEAGTPLFGVDFDADNLPQEVARNDRAISFTKGCYLGQETVARIDALGHVNQEIAGVQFHGSDVPASGGELLHDGTPAGRITSAAFSPRLGAPLALAMIRRQWLAPETVLQSPMGACEVVRLPVE